MTLLTKFGSWSRRLPPVIARGWEDFLTDARPETSIADYGAVGDGATDNLSSIQEAIDYVDAAGGGTVIIPAGTYLVSGALQINHDHITMVGTGLGSILQTTSATENVINIGDGVANRVDITLRDFSIKSSVTRTAGWYINCNKIYRAHLNNLLLGIPYGGIKLTDTFHITLQAVKMWSIRREGIHIDGGAEQYLNQCLFISSDSIYPYAIIRLKDTSAVWMSDISALWGQYGLLVDPGDGDIVENVFVSQGAIEGCVYDAIRITPSHANGKVRRFFFGNGSWACMSNRGVLIGDVGTMVGITFDHAIICYNAEHGVFVQSGEEWAILNSYVMANNTDAGSFDGVRVAADCSNFRIIGNRIGDDFSTWTGTPNYGVNILAGTSDYYIVAHNDLHGCTTAGLNDGGSGANKIVSPNL